MVHRPQVEPETWAVMAGRAAPSAGTPLNVPPVLASNFELGSGRAYSLIPARANGQPAFGSYVRGPDGVRHATGVFVLTLAGDQISALARFDSSVLPWFGLPRSLPPR